MAARTLDARDPILRDELLDLAPDVARAGVHVATCVERCADAADFLARVEFVHGMVTDGASLKQCE